MELCDISLHDWLKGNSNWPSDHYEARPDPFLTAPDFTPGPLGHQRWQLYCIIFHVVRATAHMHRHRIIHRDLKPHNSTMAFISMIADDLVLYSLKSQRWKVTDFGFARNGGGQCLQYSSGGNGTHSYRAPELISDDPQFSNETDIWALGCIFYELHTRTKLFRDGDWTVRKWHEGDKSEMVKIPTPSDAIYIMRTKQEEHDLLNQMLNRKWYKRPSAEKLEETITKAWKECLWKGRN
jgi:serine/threonine protein kinase